MTGDPGAADAPPLGDRRSRRPHGALQRRIDDRTALELELTALVVIAVDHADRSTLRAVRDDLAARLVAEDGSVSTRGRERAAEVMDGWAGDPGS